MDFANPYFEYNIIYTIGSYNIHAYTLATLARVYFQYHVRLALMINAIGSIFHL